MSLFGDLIKNAVKYSTPGVAFRDYFQNLVNVTLAQRAKRVEAPSYSTEELLNMGGSENFLNRPEMRSYQDALKGSQNNYQALQEQLANPTANRRFNEMFNVSPEEQARQSGSQLYGYSEDNPQGQFLSPTVIRDLVGGASMVGGGLTAKALAPLTGFSGLLARGASNVAEGVTEGYAESTPQSIGQDMLYSGIFSGLLGLPGEALDNVALRKQMQQLKVPDMQQFLKNISTDPNTGLLRTYAGNVDLRPSAQISGEQRLWSEVLANAKKPKLTETELEKTIRGTKGRLKGKDLGVELPNLSTQQDVTTRLISGENVTIPEGENLKPYTIKGKNQIYVRDGKTYILPESGFKRLLANSDVSIKRPFAEGKLKNYKYVTLAKRGSEKTDLKGLLNTNKYKAMTIDNLLNPKTALEKKLKASLSADEERILKEILIDYTSGKERYVPYYLEGKKPVLNLKKGYTYLFSDSGEDVDSFLRRVEDETTVNLKPEYGAERWSNYNLETNREIPGTYSETLLYRKNPNKPVTKLPAGYKIKQIKDLDDVEKSLFQSYALENDSFLMNYLEDYVLLHPTGYPIKTQPGRKALERVAIISINNQLENGFEAGHFSTVSKPVWDKYGLEFSSHGRAKNIEIDVPNEKGGTVKKVARFVDELQSDREAAIRKGRHPFLLPFPDDEKAHGLNLAKQLQLAVEDKADYVLLNNADIQRKRNRLSNEIKEIQWSQVEQDPVLPYYKGKKQLTVSDFSKLERGDAILIPESAITQGTNHSLRRYVFLGPYGTYDTPDKKGYAVLDEKKFKDWFREEFPERKKVINPFNIEEHLTPEEIKKIKKKSTYTGLSDKEFIKKMKMGDVSLWDFAPVIDQKYQLRRGSFSDIYSRAVNRIELLNIETDTPPTRGLDFDKKVKLDLKQRGTLTLYVKNGTVIDTSQKTEGGNRELIGKKLKDLLNGGETADKIISSDAGNLYGKEIDDMVTWADVFYGKGGANEQKLKELTGVKKLEEVKLPADLWKDARERFYFYFDPDDIKRFLTRDDPNISINSEQIEETILDSMREYGAFDKSSLNNSFGVGDLISEMKTEGPSSFNNHIVLDIDEKTGKITLMDKDYFESELNVLTEGKLDEYPKDLNIFDADEKALEKYDLNKQKVNRFLYDLLENNLAYTYYFDQPTMDFRGVRLDDNIVRKIKGLAPKYPVSDNLFEDYVPEKETGKFAQALTSNLRFPNAEGWANIPTKAAADYIEQLMQKGTITKGPEARMQIIEALRESGRLEKNVNVGQILQRILQ